MREAIVLLPGMMSDARLFGPQIADLSLDNAVMCAPVSQGERVEEIASGLLDVLPKRFALMGHGFGGIIAMEVIRRAPDRVSRLALSATTPLAETPAQAALREPRIIRAKAGRLEEVMREELPNDVLVAGPHRAEIQHMLWDMANRLGADVFSRQSRALQRRRDQQSTLRRISVPTLVMCGAQDILFPEKRHTFMSELIPGAHLEVIEGAGHFPMLEAAEATSRALRGWMAQPLVLR